MGMELEKFKALHKQQRRYEKQIVEEKERTDSWIRGLSETSSRDQQRLEKTIESPSTELREVKGRWSRGVSESSNEFGCEDGSRNDSRSGSKDGSRSGSRSGSVNGSRSEVELEREEGVVLLSAGGRAVSLEGEVQPLIRRRTVSRESLELSSGLDSRTETGGNADPVLGMSAALTWCVVTASGASPLTSVAPLLSTTSRLSVLSVPFVPSTGGRSAHTSVVPSISMEKGMSASVWTSRCAASRSDVCTPLLVAPSSSVPTSTSSGNTDCICQ